MNYTLRFTSGLWHNGERTRQHECEDPDDLIGSAAYPPWDHGELVVWSFLACQGRLGIPAPPPPTSHQFLIESFGTESSGDPDSEGPDHPSPSRVCEDKAEVKKEVGLLKDSIQSKQPQGCLGPLPPWVVAVTWGRSQSLLYNYSIFLCSL